MPGKPLPDGPHSLRSTNKTTSAGKAHTRPTPLEAQRRAASAPSAAGRSNALAPPAHRAKPAHRRSGLSQFAGPQGGAKRSAAGDCDRGFPLEASDDAQQRSCEGVSDSYPNGPGPRPARSGSGRSDRARWPKARRPPPQSPRANALGTAPSATNCYHPRKKRAHTA
jgi:hypothetical protein